MLALRVIVSGLSLAMAKKDHKKNKIEVPVTQGGPVLKHSPFAALGSIGALPSASTQSLSTAEPERIRDDKLRGRLVLRREKKQRGGKTVLIVAGLRAQAQLSESEIAELAQDMKQQLGCGGTVERAAADSELVLQGDQPARVAELLRARGFRVEGVTS